jgi:hypothetical protein
MEELLDSLKLAQELAFARGQSKYKAIIQSCRCLECRSGFFFGK